MRKQWGVRTKMNNIRHRRVEKRKQWWNRNESRYSSSRASYASHMHPRSAPRIPRHPDKSPSPSVENSRSLLHTRRESRAEKWPRDVCGIRGTRALGASFSVWSVGGGEGESRHYRLGECPGHRNEQSPEVSHQKVISGLRGPRLSRGRIFFKLPGFSAKPCLSLSPSLSFWLFANAPRLIVLIPRARAAAPALCRNLFISARARARGWVRAARFFCRL